jgi:hypothetical protein
MLAKKRVLTMKGDEIARTPILVPSFSSKGFPEVDKIVRTSEEFIEGEMLLSAYDLHHKHIDGPFDFASLIFLDSGGYEASKDVELSDLGMQPHEPLKWTSDMHSAVLNSWEPKVPTVAISYDHPHDRYSISEQIARARDALPPRHKMLREMLLKPETVAQSLLNIDHVLSAVHSLADFDVIGVTEKEIGNSVLARMINIAKLRCALSRAGLEIPIHIFGSLDTISTPLYFVAGADIFDGLTWLRFAFMDGYTLYKQNYGSLALGVEAKAHLVDGRCWFNNYYEMRELQLAMRRFLSAGDFSSFPHHSDLIRKAYQSALEAIGGENGR